MPWTEPQWSGDLCPCAPMRSQTWARASVYECSRLCCSRAKMAPHTASLLCDSPEILACDMASICVLPEKKQQKEVYAFQKVLAHLSYPVTHLHLYKRFHHPLQSPSGRLLSRLNSQANPHPIWRESPWSLLFKSQLNHSIEGGYLTYTPRQVLRSQGLCPAAREPALLPRQAADLESALSLEEMEYWKFQILEEWQSWGMTWSVLAIMDETSARNREP